MKLRKSYNVFWTIATVSLAGVFAFLAFNSVKTTFADDGEENNSHFVTIHDGEDSLTIRTDAKTVGEALTRAKIDIDSHDLVDPDTEAAIDSDNFDIDLYRARPVIVTDGKTKKYLMTATYDRKKLANEAGFNVALASEVKSVQSNQNVLESGMTETYKIVKNDDDAAFEKIDEKDADFKKIANPISSPTGSSIENPIKTDVSLTSPAFVTNPDEQTCKSWILAAGVSSYDLDVAYWIVSHESHCRYNATNRSSGAYGIPQSLPGSKMASMGADWKTNPITQIKWMNWYVNNRYGGWQGAKNWWVTHNWY